MSGPTYAGGVYQRNRTSWSFSPNQNIPTGAALFLAMGGTVPDDDVITVSDSKGNTYTVQVNSQQPGTIGTLFVYVAKIAQALTPQDTITIASTTRADLLLTLFFYTGVKGSIYSTDVEWSAGTQPQGTVQAVAGMSLLAILAVAGPNNDGFTNDPNWDADQKPSIQTVNATIHACGRGPVVADGAVSYAPVLGSNRQSVLLVASFL